MILNLVKKEDPILRTKLEEFDFENPPVNPAELAQNLAETMIANKGIGLAANQIGLNERVFVISYGDYKKAFFNPSLKTVGEWMMKGFEGCLSIPQVNKQVTRNHTVLLSYEDEDCQSQTIQLDGVLSIIAQHEYDHLEGILFIDHVENLQDYVCPNCGIIHKNDKRYCTVECYKESKLNKRS